MLSFQILPLSLVFSPEISPLVFGRQYQYLLQLSLTDTSELGKNITTCFRLVFKTTKRKPFFDGPENHLLLFIGRL